MARSAPLESPRGGREELRAAGLRPALLHLEDAEGAAVVQALLRDVGLPASELARDTAWVPVSCAQTILEAVVQAAGESAVSSRGRHVTNPQLMGPYMRLLRQATSPREAYRYVVSTSSEFSRLGSYTLVLDEETRTRIEYAPLDDADPGQEPRCLCLLRQADLKALPCLWGLPEATLTETNCLANGDLGCSYDLSWQSGAPRVWPMASLLAAFGCGVLGATFAGAAGAMLAVALGAGFGGAAGLLHTRLRRERAARARETHRVLALEQNLEQRGELAASPSDLSDCVLGGKYRMLHPIANGGIGTVYAAEHLGVGYRVAVKVLRGAAAVNAAEVARLRREARIQMSLEHPNIVRTFDLDQLPDGTLYVVMELLGGLSLQEQLKHQSPLDPAFLMPIFLQTCRALSAAHRQGIVHRDLKPGNIFLCDGGLVKILDFGMSKLAAGDALTQDGYTLGTPEYMSPEQCAGNELDERSDLYALGVLMHEALTGELPFRATSRRALLEQHQRREARPMRRVYPALDISEALDQIVLTCLAKRPEDRPPSAEQLERMLAVIPRQMRSTPSAHDLPYATLPAASELDER